MSYTLNSDGTTTLNLNGTFNTSLADQLGSFSVTNGDLTCTCYLGTNGHLVCTLQSGDSCNP